MGRWRVCWDFMYTNIHRLRLKIVVVVGWRMEVSGGSGGFWLGFYLRKHSWVFNVEWCVGLYTNVSGGGVLEG